MAERGIQMNEQKIEGMPDGWRLVRIGTPNKGDCFIDAQGDVKHCSGGYHAFGYAIIEKIEQSKQYRPFANAAEFEPHRDRWFKPKFPSYQCIRTTAYNDRGHWVGEESDTWEQMFQNYIFDDGSPFGVEVTE